LPNAINNITTIVYPTLGTSKESVTQPDYLVAKFKYDVKTTAILAPRRNLKTTEDGTRSVELSKAVISSRNTDTAAKLSSFTPVDQQEEKSTGASMRKALKKNKRYQANPQLYRTRQELKRSGNHENK
jgi:hypothetical protein